MKMLSPKLKLASALVLISLMIPLSFAIPARLVMAAGTPDAYGQQIQFVLIYQWTGTAWVKRGNVTTAAYSSGYDVDVTPNQPTRFFVCSEFNDDFNTAKTESEALADIRVYITINVAQVSRTLMTDHNSTYKATGDWWRSWSSYLWNSTGKPTAGASYTVVIEFEAYFSPDEYTA